MLKLILAFFRPALDYASMGAGIFAGLEGQYEATHLPRPNYQTPSDTNFRASEADFMAALQAITQSAQRNQGMIDPVLLQAYSQMLGIDMTPLITAGGQAGDQYKQLASTGTDLSRKFMGQGDAISTAAFDPESQLHDFARGQTIDTSRAADSSRGIAMSPYSSGNESTAVRNFEMDWRDRALGREMSGSQGAQGAYGAGFNYASGVPGSTMAGATTPIGAQTTAYGAPMQFSNAFLGAEGNMMQPYYGVMSSALPYMGYSTGANSQQFQNDLMRSIQQYQMLNKAQGQLDMGYDYNSGAGNPASYMGMGGGGGGGGMAGGYPG